MARVSCSRGVQECVVEYLWAGGGAWPQTTILVLACSTQPTIWDHLPLIMDMGHPLPWTQTHRYVTDSPEDRPTSSSMDRTG